jgi:hypothetical protein
MHPMLPIWQRLLLTIVAMLAASWIGGLLWNFLFSFALPSFLAGIIGGLTALSKDVKIKDLQEWAWAPQTLHPFSVPLRLA